jgi:hypothetical protein
MSWHVILFFDFVARCPSIDQFSRDSLPVCVLWHCLEFCSIFMNIYLVSSVITCSRTSLLANITASVFLIIIFILTHTKIISPTYTISSHNSSTYFPPFAWYFLMAYSKA